MDQLPALVERAEFFTQPIDVLSALQCECGSPQPPLPDAAENRQAGKTAKMLVRNRTEYRAAFPEQLKPQWRTLDFQCRVACGESPWPRCRGSYVAGCGASQHDAVIGPRTGSNAQAKHAFANALHFEDIADRTADRRSEVRRVDALL